MPRHRFIASFLACLGVVGCAPINSRVKESANLPVPKMSPDSIVLEVTFVELPPGVAEIEEKIWHDVDEQVVARDVRRRLDANGIRCGLAGSQLPDSLQLLLQHRKEAAEQGNSLELSTEVTNQMQRLQLRRGRAGKIATTNGLLDRLVILNNDEGHLGGETVQQAQCMLGVTSDPQGDGGVRLEITPQVEHGEPKTTFVGQHQQGSWLMDTSRDLRTFDDLRIDTTIAPGQILLIGCTSELRGLGRQFFTETTGGKSSKKLLMVRLAQTQLDDLFAPEQIIAPIVSTAD